jgi:acetyl esterase
MLRRISDLFASAHAYRGPPLSDCAGIGAASEALEGANAFIYRRAGGRDLRAHVFGARSDTSARARPALLYFFGGAFRAGDVNEFAAQARVFAERGYIATCADYRVLCRDNVTPAAGVDDARAAADWLSANAHKLGVDRQHIVLAGASAGGLLALAAALRGRCRPAALVLFNPVIDVRSGQFNYGMGERQAAAISPAVLPLSDLPPTLILHGEADSVVPLASARKFQARAAAAGRVCELVTYKELGHSFFQRRDAVQSLSASPFDDTLRRTFTFLEMTLG